MFIEYPVHARALHGGQTLVGERRRLRNSETREGGFFTVWGGVVRVS